MHSKYATCPQVPRRWWILVGCCIAYATGIGMIVCYFAFSEEEITTELHEFHYKIPDNYKYLIFVLFTVVAHIILFTGQDLAVVLICCIYHNLECMISDCKKELTSVYYNSRLTPEVMHNLASNLQQLSSVISKTDQIISPIAFNLLCTFLFQILVLTALLLKTSVIVWHLITGTCLGTALLFKVCILVIFGSRINERFCEIRTVISSYPAFQEGVLTDISAAVNHIALSQMVQTAAENAQMTAMGVISIRKSVILSVVCGFVSYSVLLYQVFEE
ncbi:hypothetical protein HNY73_006295 [Argiope bruennichi]|uniref:Gustatory receptor n=1 Tax=Argiope bruennichi TaxID=94029 RepID=A0A8T0FPP5_ARGBR|nr:hypothetical protein HNY73_006295 [Argiope bruennichi]